MKQEYSSKIYSIAIFSGIIAWFLGVFSSHAADPDLWGYLAFGRLFWEQGSFPYHDVFSYMPTKAVWIYHEWLTGVIFFPIYQNFGACGLQVLKFTIGMLTVGFVYAIAVKRKAIPIFAFVVLILIGNVVRFGYSPVRAQIFTFLFFAFSLYILNYSKMHKKYNVLWWFVPIELLWCNLHGGFVGGLGMIGLYAVGEFLAGRKFLPYAAILIIASLITFVNPYGFEYWQYIFQALLMPRPEIAEWKNLFAVILSGEYRGYGMLFIIVFVLTVTLILWHPKWDITIMMILSVTAIMGFLHVRHMVFFALAAGAYLPAMLTQLWESLSSNPIIVKRYSRFRKMGIMLVVLILCSTAGSSFYQFVSGTPFKLETSAAHYPVGAMEIIQKHHFKGNILPHFEWGEYLLWKLHPDCKVGMDGRYETVYHDNIGREYFDFLFARNHWKDFLRKYPHDMVLVKPDSKISGLLFIDSDWRLLYVGKDSALFLRR